MSWTVADAVDYKGFPADRSKTGGWVPAALILGLFTLLVPLMHAHIPPPSTVQVLHISQ